MPTHRSNQTQNASSKYPKQTGSGVEKVSAPPQSAESLRYSGGAWQYNHHKLAGWVALGALVTSYDPNIQATAVLINDSSNTVRQIHVDLAGNGWDHAQATPGHGQQGITLSLLTNVVHRINITRIYVDDTNLTNATHIVLME